MLREEYRNFRNDKTFMNDTARKDFSSSHRCFVLFLFFKNIFARYFCLLLEHFFAVIWLTSCVIEPRKTYLDLMMARRSSEVVNNGF